MNTLHKSAIALTVILLAGAISVPGLVPDDPDHDGVPASDDDCPSENASGFDRDGDGCIDDGSGVRHPEYWGSEDAVIMYFINDQGAPGVAGNGDLDAIQASFNAWTSIPGTEMDATYGGTVPQEIANGLDGANLVTFVDETYPFGLSTLAVGLTTSFETDTLIDARVYRPGEIFDADMIFNPAFTFGTSASPGVRDIQSVATHEAGHILGLSHTAVRTSTMYFVLPPSQNARSLEDDDVAAFRKAYGSAATMSNSSRLEGTVVNGQTSDGVPGAIVFVINEATNDTSACDFTMPDGSFTFIGLADGDYFVSIRPLDGTSPIDYMTTGNVNAFISQNIAVDFLPESYDAAESNTDDSNDRTAVAVTAGSTTTVAIVTNIDAEPPVVMSASPSDGTTGAAIDGAYVIRFSERIATSTLSDAFSFRSGAGGVAGNIAVLDDDSVIVFTPLAPLAFSTTYTLTLDSDLEDLAGNALASSFEMSITTEAEPPVSISSLAPNKGVVGNVIVINGRGFDPGATVTLNGADAPVARLTPNSILVQVPDLAETGDVVVTNPDATTSNALVFTVLSQAEVARGYESGSAPLSSAPNALALAPDGSYAYAAVGGGVEAVVVDPTLGGYLSHVLIANPGVFVDVAASPDGNRVYAVNETSDEMIEIMSDPSSGLLFHTILASRPLGAAPRGIVVDPFGYRAYISTDQGEVQVWDIRLGSVNYQEQVSVLRAPDGISLVGPMAIMPAGDQLIAVGGSGELFFFALGPDTLESRVTVNPNARDLVIDPQGQRAYVGGSNGVVSVVSVEGAPFFVQDISTGGGIRGLDTTPAGLYLYASNRELNNMPIVDLDETHGTFRSVIENAPQMANPVDVAVSSDGVYAYSVLQGDVASGPRLSVTTIGLGPTLMSMVPTAGQPGTQVVFTLAGVGEDPGVMEVDFNGTTVVAEQVTLTTVLATVPAGATTGPAKCIFTMSGATSGMASNPMRFEIIEPSNTGNIRFSGNLPRNPALSVCDYITPAVAISPSGEYLYTGCGGSNEVNVYDIRPGSPNFQKHIGTFGTGGTGDVVSDISITADGKVAFVAGGEEDLADRRRIQTFYADPADPRFLARGPAVPTPNQTIPFVTTSSNNRTVVTVTRGTSDNVMILTAGGVSQGIAPGFVDSTGTGQTVVDVVHHPSSRVAYVALQNGLIRIFDTDFSSPNFGVSVMTFATGLTEIWSLAVSGDGLSLYVYGYFYTDLYPYIVQTYSTNAPADPTFLTSCETNLESVGPTNRERFALAPQGDLAIRSLGSTGLFRWNTDCSAGPADVPFLTQNLLDMAFTPNGTRLYVANQSAGQIQSFDFVTVSDIIKVSGDNQNGVADQALPAPARVQLTSSSGGSVEGVPVVFTVTGGGGEILTAGGPVASVVVAADEQGFAQVDWKLGAALGDQTLNANAFVIGRAGATFHANAGDDPTTLPLSLAEVVPLNGSSDISPSTALLATFSRPIDPATISSASFYLRAAPTGPALPATFGFTDSDRKISVTPSAALNVATAYEIVLTGAIAAPGGSALTNPTVSSFTTIAATPLRLSSVWPPSAIEGVPVTLSGTGFDPVFSANTVMFNGVAATPISGTSDALRVNVPIGALSGPVTVVVGASTSNSVAFAVLERSTSRIDDVVATIGQANGTKSVALSGDGALCYSVSTDGDVVIPVNLEDETTYPSIPVGDQPVAIVMHPANSLSYIANFGSGSVSLINVDQTSLDFNRVVTSINVGANPTDLAIAPDGDRLAVANAGSSDVSIVDTDETSVAYNQVVATIGVASGSKSVAYSGDGTLYVGTNTSILVMRATEGTGYEVTATIGTASGTKSVAISGDGTLLFALTDAGELLVIDIQDGSPSENSVVATIGTANGTKSVAVSGDGTLLYLVQEDSDEVVIIEIELIPGVGVVNPDGASAFTVRTRQVGTLVTGDDPSDVAVDPSGSGRVVVTNTGDRTITVYGRAFTAVQATFKVVPGIIIPKLPGLYVLGILELPSPLNVHDVDLASVRVFGTVPIAPGLHYIDDVDHDGIDDLSMLFCRDAFLAAMPENGEHIDVVCTGIAAGEEFEGHDDIRVLRPTITRPEENERLPAGQPFTFRWTTPLQILPCDQVKIEWRQNGDDADHINCDFHVDSEDMGGLATVSEMDELQRLDESADVASDDWILIANHVNNDGDYTWNVPFGYFPNARLRITLLWFGLKVGSSEVPFMIEMPVPTRLKSFDVTMEDGSAVLRWETSFESGMLGYDVVRSQEKDGRYDVITKEMVTASGSTSGGVYEYRDATLSANRTYWYKLREVADNGLGAEYGPYSVTYRVSNQLDQNHPNPFNPTTVIKYGIASDNQVNLTIYDVAGRKVRTLVNERQRADVYRVTWDGMNDTGAKVASGVYFYKLVAGKFTQTKKMVLLK